MNTLIIYDWDDTLFPTSYIHRIEDFQTNKFSIIERFNIRLLEKSRQSGHVLIITNAATEWIYASAKKYMYRLYQYLKYTNIPVISAREFANSRQMYNYEKWKDITFYDTINRYMNIIHKHINNIISVGDAMFERNALIKYGHYINNKEQYRAPNNIYIKTIKYINNPIPDALINQTKSLLNNIEYHIQVKGDLNIDM